MSLISDKDYCLFLISKMIEETEVFQPVQNSYVQDKREPIEPRPAPIKRRAPQNPPPIIKTTFRPQPNPEIVHLVKNPKSALTELLNNKTENPFQSFAAVHTGENSLELTLFFKGRKITVSVSKVSTVEKVIGYVLYQCVNDKVQLTTHALTAYNLMIAEEDGEIDDDFPALDKRREVVQTGVDTFALVCSENSKVAEEAIEFKPTPSITLTELQTKSTLSPEKVLSPVISDSMFIKVHLYSTVEVMHTTTITVSKSTKLNQVLEIVCKKRKINHSDYVLKTKEFQDIDLNKTAGDMDLSEYYLLKKKEDGASAGDVFLRPLEESMSATSARPEKHIFRTGLMKANHEKGLTLDADFLHIMTTNARHSILAKNKTQSYHSSSIKSCVHSKGTAYFKLVVRKEDGSEKPMEFEAQNVSEATEICSSINFLFLNK